MYNQEELNQLALEDTDKFIEALTELSEEDRTAYYEAEVERVIAKSGDPEKLRDWHTQLRKELDTMDASQKKSFFSFTTKYYNKALDGVEQKISELLDNESTRHRD